MQIAAKDNQHLRLILDAHITLAFAAGSVLNIKSGRSVEIEQRTIHRSVWHSGDMPRDPSWPGWEFELETLNGNEGEMAVAVCLTHDVVQAVQSSCGFVARGECFADRASDLWSGSAVGHMDSTPLNSLKR